jgi:hypothetical protein
MTPAPIDQLALRSRILEIVNVIVTLEGGPAPVADVRIVAAPAFFDQTHGMSMLQEDGSVVLRIAVQRPADQVADTVLHETAHVLLGTEHIDQPDHGPGWRSVYQELQQKYRAIVLDVLTELP